MVIRVEPIPEDLGHKAGDTIDGVPTYHSAQKHTRNHTLKAI